MFIMNKFPYFLLPLLVILSGTVIGAIATCFLLKAEFIKGQQPYFYNLKTSELTIDINVKVLHKDQVITSKPLKKTISVDISNAFDWPSVTKLIDAAIEQEMMTTAQELCHQKGCNK